MTLRYMVFLHSYLGFMSTSTLLYGEHDAIPIDAPQLRSDCHRMIAEIIPMRKNLTHVYASRFHPVALPSVVRDIAFSSAHKMRRSRGKRGSYS